MVRASSARSIEHWEPLKSKRWVISRIAPWTALSTSVMSVRETISKEGISGITIGRPGGRDKKTESDKWESGRDEFGTKSGTGHRRLQRHRTGRGDRPRARGI